jgi:hypothetical protein
MREPGAHASCQGRNLRTAAAFGLEKMWLVCRVGGSQHNSANTNEKCEDSVSSGSNGCSFKEEGYTQEGGKEELVDIG